MKKIFVIFFLLFNVPQAKADLFGGDLPLLAQIVTNTLYSMYELQRQTEMWNEQMRGVKDKIYRIETIKKVVQPSDWDKWKDPNEALKRIQLIYQTLPKEYRSEKADMIEAELSRAMNLIARVNLETKSTFESGKELEDRGLNSSPAVAQKLTASGMGTMISQQAQSQVLQSHMVSLLAQMLAEGHEKETRFIVNKGIVYNNVSQSLNPKQNSFSQIVLSLGGKNE